MHWFRGKNRGRLKTRSKSKKKSKNRHTRIEIPLVTCPPHPHVQDVQEEKWWVRYVTWLLGLIFQHMVTHAPTLYTCASKDKTLFSFPFKQELSSKQRTGCMFYLQSQCYCAVIHDTEMLHLLRRGSNATYMTCASECVLYAAFPRFISQTALLLQLIFSSILPLPPHHSIQKPCFQTLTIINTHIHDLSVWHNNKECVCFHKVWIKYFETHNTGYSLFITSHTNCHTLSLSEFPVIMTFSANA